LEYMLDVYASVVDIAEQEGVIGEGLVLYHLAGVC